VYQNKNNLSFVRILQLTW